MSGSAQRLCALLRERGETLAAAESLTGGAVSAAIVDIPGASQVFQGGVVAYSYEVKAAVLGVSRERLASHGAVDALVAEQMARGVAERCGAQWGLATTGVAGPGPSEGHEEGTVYVAVAHASQVVSRCLQLSGGRAQIRAGSVDAVLALACDMLEHAPQNAGI